MKTMSGLSRVGARGFTMVELILVMVILATLAAIVVPKFVGRSEQAKDAAAKTDISIYSAALDQFEVDNGFYPKSSEGLNALIAQPKDANSWRGPYVKDVHNDPWGSPYVYIYPGKQNERTYDLSSSGPDKRAGTDDDITDTHSGAVK
jgi:general secretion pathway protein G